MEIVERAKSQVETLEHLGRVHARGYVAAGDTSEYGPKYRAQVEAVEFLLWSVGDYALQLSEYEKLSTRKAYVVAVQNYREALEILDGMSPSE